VIAPHVPQLQAGLGEVLINRAGGMVPAEAEDLFSAVLNVETKNLAALYYLGLAALQRQDDVGARAYWQILAERAPQDAPWYRDFMMNYTALMADGA
jgi:cytochrome c-type biogenesis protein CcmH